MAINWRKAAKIGISVFDQALLSGISLLISLIFVKHLDKEEYGLYVLLFNSALFFQGIGGALLSAPYTTIYPRKQGQEQHAVIRAYSRSTLAYALGSAATGVIACVVYRAVSGDLLMSLSAATGFGICIFGSVSKDNIRVFHYSQNNQTAALTGNVVYGILLIACLAWMIHSQWVSATSVLLAIGTTGALVSVPRLLSLDTQADMQASVPSAATPQLLLREFWSCGRWAVLGSFVTFLTSNTYPYLAAASFSKSDVADISVARILSMPIALIGAAWFNLMRPRLSQWAADGLHEKLERIVRISVLSAAALSILEGAALYFSGDLIRVVFGEKYANLQVLTLLWTAQTGFAFIRGIYAATLMSSDVGYKDLSQIGIITLVGTFIVMFAASLTAYAASIVLALTALEVLQIALILRKRHHMQVQRCPAFN